MEKENIIVLCFYYIELFIKYKQPETKNKSLLQISIFTGGLFSSVK